MTLSKRDKWWFNGTLGTILFGSGLSLTMESGFWKHDGSRWFYWAIGGTAGLGLALSGPVLLIRAGILKREMNREKGK